jgi:hypothetical protein
MGVIHWVHGHTTNLQQQEQEQVEVGIKEQNAFKLRTICITKAQQ